LVSAGLTPAEAAAQVQRFRLTPGYQLCYTLGRYEIKRLADALGPQMGRDRFYRALLEGGQLPFHWVEQRLKKSGAGLDSGKETI
ncbi:MAG: hypothetical protein JRI36_05965, partial [Deltaproteobacteria bacterium]|nr:hypothetical protein [Deltaproteobacteria bacterium]